MTLISPLLWCWKNCSGDRLRPKIGPGGKLLDVAGMAVQPSPAEELGLVFPCSGNEKLHGQKRAQNMLNLRLKRIGVSGGPTRAANSERSFFIRPFMASSDTSHR